jgi:hypothetical protein
MNNVTAKSGAEKFQICLFLTKVFVSEIVGFDAKRLSPVDYVKIILWLDWTGSQLT